MSFTTFSSEEFDQDISRANRVTQDGPVFITDNGNPKHVLLSIEEYRRLSGTSLNIVELLGMSGVEDITFDPPRMGEMHDPW
jgi:hypothetical protein